MKNRTQRTSRCSLQCVHSIVETHAFMTGRAAQQSAPARAGHAVARCGALGTCLGMMELIEVTRNEPVEFLRQEGKQPLRPGAVLGSSLKARYPCLAHFPHYLQDAE